MGETAAKKEGEEFPVSVKQPVKKDVQKISKLQPAKHEVIIKFARAQEKLILALLEEHSFSHVKVIPKDKTNCFAYCQFTGDIRRLDEQLRILKSKALLSCGKQKEDESAILEFFVDFDELLPISSALPKPKKKKDRLALWVDIIGVTILLLSVVALRHHLIIEKRLAPSISTAKIVEPVSIYPAWNMFILPIHQAGWIGVKKTFALDEKTMVELFKRIKSTGDDGYGKILSDLTMYPKIIKRALGLIILKDVKDVNQFQELVEDLKGKYLYSRPFPDQLGRTHQYASFLDNWQFENDILIAFCECLSKDSSFVSSLINRIWDSQKE